MIPRNILLISLKKIAAILSVLVLISFMAGCGGGGGGDDDGGGAGTESVTISGTADDGTLNSPISRAECAFVDLNGDRLFGTKADNIGRFSIKVPPDVEGYIRCAPPGIPKLILSTFSSTKGLATGDKISGEDVTPATTLVVDIINSEDAAVPMARKLELLAAIENEDPELSLLVDLGTRLYKAMLYKQLNVRYGGDDSDDAEGGHGGGVGGDAGDGADFSPIPNARCEFLAMELEGEELFAPDLKKGEVLFDAALADFCNDGMVNRPDLEAIAEEVNQAFEGRQTEIMAAIANRFSECIGHPYRTIADGVDSETPGRYFLPIPPNIQGFVRCTPPDLPELKLATFVSTEGLADGDKISGQDVTPAMTFFSHSVATELSDDLRTVKENYLDDIAGLGDIQIITDGEMITRFELQDTADPNDEDVGLVAFSATSLFNILYKNETNVDYLALLNDLIQKKKVDPKDLQNVGIPKNDADNWSVVVNTSNDTAGDELGTNLSKALSTARIRVTVTDQPGEEGKGIPGADVDINGAPSGVVCENCPGVSDNNGEVILTLTGVKTEPVQIEVEALVAGFEPTTKTAEVVAFATVDLEIAVSHKLTLQGGGNGNGTVTSSPIGISCDISGGVASGDDNIAYESGTEVTLAAKPSVDSTFDGWSGGGCSGTGDCTVLMNQAHTVIATFTLKAPPCTYSILPPSLSFTSSGGSGSVSVTSPGGCSWSASESVPWITITSGSGSGNGTVNYSVSANSGKSSRTAVITVAGRSHTVTQAGVTCTYSISPTSRSFTSSGGIGSISVTSPGGCSWSASESVPWITITSGSGSGNGTVSYTVSANSGTSSRTAVITVAGKSHTVTQTGVSCTYSISPPSRSFTSSAGPGSIAVTTPGGCSWTASESVGWITITSGSSGSGNGTVNYSVLANSSTNSRTAVITVAGRSHTVTQAGVTCTYSISPTSRSFTSSAGTGSIAITSPGGCSWSASESVPWITITSGSGSGNGTVSYTVSANSGTSSRTAVITVAGKSHTVTQTGVTCTYSISPPSRSFTSSGGSGSISVTSPGGCSWTASESVGWITITSGSSGNGNGTVSYTVSANSGTSSRTAVITVAGKSHTVTQTGVSCTYSISPTSRSFTSSGGSGSISVTSPGGCSWSASESVPWITITSGSGSGNGTVSYTVSANSSTSSRTAVITVAGKSHTVTQTGVSCTYSISPTSRSFTSSGGSGSISVTSPGGCSWTASESVGWITITSGSSGSGNGTVNYSVSANSGTSSRTAVITVAGKSHTVTQTGVSCTYSISPTSRSFTSSAGTGSIAVTTPGGCSWTASESVGWITITSGNSGSGNGTVNYSVSANSSTSSRTAVITVAGKSHTVTQAGVSCTYSISPTSRSFTSSAGTGSIAVTTPGGCSWTASESVGWITITSGSSGSGNGTVNYSVLANSSTSSRTAVITVAGRSHTVTQAGVTCTYSISPTSRSFTSSAGTGSIAVTSPGGCSWSASESVPWITITSGSGSGNGTVSYTVSANTVTSSRTATITVAGKVHTVTQGPAPCTYTISPPSRSFTYSGGNGSISVTSASGCSWTASESVGWITITSGNSGSGNGTVSYTVSANTVANSRTATITVAGKVHTVTQGPAPCTYTISPPSRSFTAAGGTGSIAVSASSSSCSWTASESVGWITITSGNSGSGNGTVSYTVAANTGTSSRTAVITVAGKSHTVNQTANTSPTISTPALNLIQLNDPSCNLYGDPVGSLFLITFGYTDPDGNGPTNISQAKMDIAYDFPGCCDGGFNNYTWNSSLSGDGYRGTATTRQCYRFGSNSYVDVTMTIEDLIGSSSNPLTVRIAKPRGSN